MVSEQGFRPGLVEFENQLWLRLIANGIPRQAAKILANSYVHSKSTRPQIVGYAGTLKEQTGKATKYLIKKYNAVPGNVPNDKALDVKLALEEEGKIGVGKRGRGRGPRRTRHLG